MMHIEQKQRLRYQVLNNIVILQVVSNQGLVTHLIGLQYQQLYFAALTPFNLSESSIINVYAAHSQKCQGQLPLEANISLKEYLKEDQFSFADKIDVNHIVTAFRKSKSNHASKIQFIPSSGFKFELFKQGVVVGIEEKGRQIIMKSEYFDVKNIHKLQRFTFSSGIILFFHNEGNKEELFYGFYIHEKEKYDHYHLCKEIMSSHQKQVYFPINNRQQQKHPWDHFPYNSIGILVSSNQEIYGTAAFLYDRKNNQCRFLITCAHNFITNDYDFTLNKNQSKYKFYLPSASIMEQPDRQILKPIEDFQIKRVHIPYEYTSAMMNSNVIKVDFSQKQFKDEIQIHQEDLYDICIIELERPLHIDEGFSIQRQSKQFKEIVQTKIQTVGFPREQSTTNSLMFHMYRESNQESKRQYVKLYNFIQQYSETSQILRHTFSTLSGNSGSPIYSYINNNYYLFGIHTRGYGEQLNGSYNVGTYLYSPQIFKWLIDIDGIETVLTSQQVQGYFYFQQKNSLLLQNIQKITQLSTAYNDTYVYSKVIEPGVKWCIVHVDHKGETLYQKEYSNKIATFEMLSQQEIIILDLQNDNIEFLNLRKQTLKSVAHKYFQKEVSSIKVQVFFQTKLFCVVETEPEKHFLLKLTYYRMPTQFDQKINVLRVHEEKWSSEKMVSRMNIKSKIGWFEKEQKSEVIFYVYSLDENYEEDLMKVSVMNKIPNNDKEQEGKIVIQYIWEIDGDSYMVVSFSNQKLISDNQRVMINNYVVNVKDRTIRQANFHFQTHHQQKISIIQCFNLGDFSIFLTSISNQQQGVLYYVDNKLESICVRKKWKPNCKSLFFIPGFANNTIVFGIFDNEEASNIEVTYAEFKNTRIDIRDLSMFLMLQLQETFDANLLYDVIQLIFYSNYEKADRNIRQQLELDFKRKQQALKNKLSLINPNLISNSEKKIIQQYHYKEDSRQFQKEYKKLMLEQQIDKYGQLIQGDLLKQIAYFLDKPWKQMFPYSEKHRYVKSNNGELRRFDWQMSSGVLPKNQTKYKDRSKKFVFGLYYVISTLQSIQQRKQIERYLRSIALFEIIDSNNKNIPSYGIGIINRDCKLITFANFFKDKKVQIGRIYYKKSDVEDNFPLNYNIENKELYEVLKTRQQVPRISQNIIEIKLQQYPSNLIFPFLLRATSSNKNKGIAIGFGYNYSVSRLSLTMCQYKAELSHSLKDCFSKALLFFQGESEQEIWYEFYDSENGIIDCPSQNKAQAIYKAKQ